MNFKTLFQYYRTKQESPIPYQEFAKLSFTEADYLEYLRRIEVIRAAFILFYDSFGENGYRRADSKLREEYRKMVSDAFEHLNEFLQEFSDDVPDFEILSNMLNNLEAMVSYAGSCRMRFRYSDNFTSLIKLVNRSSTEFRFVLERTIFAVYQEEPLCRLIPYEPDKNLDISELQHQQYEIENQLMCILDDKKPVLDLNSYDSIRSWAKEEHKRQQTADDCDYLYESYEEVITDKKNQYTADKILWIYGGGSILCQRYNHEIATVNAILPTVTGDSIMIQVNFCEDCNRYFLSKTEYDFYRSRYPGLLANVQFESNDESGYDWGREEYSVLALNGYSVRKNGPSEETRHDILTFILKNKIRRKDQIIDHLDMLIRTNGAKAHMENAVQKWRADKNFVRAWNMENQREVQLDEVRKY